LHKILSVTVRILSEARRGTRNDILSGLFMLYLEGEPEKFSQPLMPSSLPVSSHVKQNETVSNPEPVPVLESEIKKDNALKEKILETAHNQNFIIYSALFHADFYDNAGDLTVRMNHAYCFAFMKASRHAASLRSMFKEYRNVIISYGNESIRCPDYEAVIEAPVKPEKKKTEPKNEPAVMPVYVPQEISFETAEPAENEQFQKSGIGKFIGELIRLNAKPEVLMISMNENGNDGENNPEEGENEE
ncbi:MAG: hypothetical protein IJG34_10135, partial [Synergistaceae bacterium]|nr:hypothetical protein [Synergistaceae bacterium]